MYTAISIYTVCITLFDMFYYLNIYTYYITSLAVCDHADPSTRLPLSNLDAHPSIQLGMMGVADNEVYPLVN